jgi:CspA family cold shock protein
MTKGIVKWYNKVKGFGFIESVEGNEIFVHRSGLIHSTLGLEPDQIVLFETKEGDKGPFATNVKSAG